MSLFGPPPGYEPGPVERDLHERWVPSEAQVAAGVAALKTVPEAERGDWIAVVALAQPGKTYGIWTLGQEVVPVPGVWLGKNSFEGHLNYGVARNAAEEAAQAWLAEHGLTGTVAYVSVREDGSAAVFEGFAREAV